MDEEIEITVKMTATQWTEMWNALESKERLIERGDFGEGEEPSANEKWLKDIRGARGALTKALESKKVTF